MNTERETPGMRATVERLSAKPVVFLHTLPRWVLLVAVFALLVIGMWGNGWVGAAGLLVLLAFLTWFAYLNWPALDTSGRALRVVAMGLLAAFAVGHVVGGF
ncbi:DUF6703 family protein [Actinomadura rudentiformis]|uniref:Uncharacterized protein n=1 Tax=Actinomadura rudentiformis TaxID=359158 RepID=A0A6H9YI13_9ACTN|nr:DUF6703 family protein [Actinomadura rudentiformis]KAB2345579.1 hypothetical protein F8566_26920 [Actinomadura rudentiformis]